MLFVAEKLAALEVVKRRLDAVGLGDACLEFHSHKTSRTSFLAELGRTLSLGEPKETGHFALRDQWETTRDRLNAYHQAINTPIGQSGLTPYQVVGKLVGNSGELVGTQSNSVDSEQLAVTSHQSSVISGESTVHNSPFTIHNSQFPGLQSPVSSLSVSQSALAELTAREYTDLRAWVLTIQTQLQQMGVPVQHPFWGSGRVNVGTHEVEQVRRLAGQALAALQAWQAAAATLADALNLTPPAGPTQLQQQLAAADLLQQAPHLYAIRADHPAWHSESQRILAGLNAASIIAHQHRHYDDLLIPEAWSQPVITIRQGLAAGQGRWGQWFSADYRRGRAQLAGLCQKPIPGDWAAQIAVVDAILEVQRQQPILAAVEPLLAELFTVRWQGLRSDWASLNQIAYWLTHLHQEIHEERIPAGMLAYLNHTTPDKKPLLEAIPAIHTTGTAYQQTIHSLLHLLQPTTEFPEFPPVPTSSPASFATLQTRLQTWLTSAGRWVEMGRWLELTQEQFRVQSSEFRVSSSEFRVALYNELETRNSKLETQVASYATTWPDAPSHLLAWFERSYYLALLAKAQAERASLRAEDAAATLDNTLLHFQQLDIAFLEHNRYRLAHEHWQKLPKHSAVGRVGLLQSEIAKKRAQRPIRTLISEVGPVIQQIKPVFMMSPLSVATFLPPGDIQFDLVIFDEASQIRPAEAYSAILRGRQVIIVGDSRQLPPTPFFERVLGEREGELELEGELEGELELERERAREREGEVGRGGEVAPPESILDLGVQRQLPQAWLRWHYRSQHESLIALSNQEFYDNQLVIFPSPDAERHEVGLVLHHRPETVYERGTTRTNPQEALLVAQKVVEHARSRPQYTLGVATFSASQQKAIATHLEILRRQNPDVEPFFQTHPTEPFFVKNLENVQGDERDVILISMGYGFTAEKKLALNFGPLNQSGGERRLNVLITRARLRCELFTNFRAEDMDVRHSQSAGVLALQKYLAYAETGALRDLAPMERAREDSLVAGIAAALQREGHAVRRIHSRINLDLAVGDPARPGYDRLALMTDGGNAALAPSARDRERLQAQVLAGLGWQPHRLWSWGWWQDGAKEWGKLREEIERLREGKVNSEQLSVNSNQSPIARYDAAAPQPRTIPAYIQADLKASLTADRGNWRYDKSNGHFYCQSFHRFDLATRQFWPEKRTRASGDYIAKVKEHPGQGDLYGSLVYAPEENQFYHSAWFTLFTPKNKMVQLLLDYERWQFYTNTDYVYSESKHDSRTRYDPISGHIENLFLNHAISIKQLYFAATVHPDIVAEVDDEVKWVEQIVEVEGPVHVDEVSRRLSLATGLTRRSAAVNEVVKIAAAAAHQQKRLRQDGKFLYPAHMTHPPVRNRANLPAVARSLMLIAPEEIEEAIRLVVQDGLGATPEEIPQAVGELFGFARLGEFQSQFVNKQIEQMLAANRLTRQGRWVLAA